MDQYTSSMQSKMSKLENLCLDLREEIFTTLQFMNSLKENFSEIVGRLYTVTDPELFLKEFMNVYSLILKYLSFLTEVNCKLEMLEISEMGSTKLISKTNHSKSNNSSNSNNNNNKALTSEVMPNSFSSSDSFFNLEFFKKLKFSNGKTAIKKITFEKLSKSNNSLSLIVKPSKSKSKKKAKKKKTSGTQLGNKSLSVSDSASTSCDSCDNNVILLCQPSKISQESFSVEKTDACADLKLNNSINEPFSDGDLVHSKITLHSNGLDSNLNNDTNKIIPLSNVSPSLKLCSDQDDEKNFQQNLSTDMSGSGNFAMNNKFADIQFSETQSLARDISIKEVLPAGTGQHDLTQEVIIESEENEIKPANVVKKLGKEYDVVIEHIKSPSEFYVSVVNDQPNALVELEKMLKSIPENKSKYHKLSENKKACISKEIGTYALFYSKCDEMWCRAKIMNWYLNVKDDYVSIFLIDYGESKCVSINDLQPMPKLYMKYPACTQRCHLSRIFPMDMHKDSKTLSWGKESTEKMKDLTENSKKVRMRVAPDDCYHPPTSLPVTLWLVDLGNQCVNEMMVKAKYALEKSDFDHVVTETKSSDRHLGDELYNWNPMKEDFESNKNSYELDMNDPAAFIYGYVGKDYDRICPHFARTGYCYKGQTCRKKHQKLDPSGFTTDQEEIFQNAFKILKVPPLRSVLNVQVTCLLTYNHFCCISDTSTISSDEENLRSLLNFMNCPENVFRMKKLLIPPSAGQIVIARYSEDRLWYRARILDSEPERDLYRIMFVDYGNKEVVSFNDIRAIEARYLHLPFQAMQCFIYGITLNTNVPVNDVMNFINERMRNGNVCIEVIARLPGEDVSILVNVFDENGRSIGRDLIEKNFVKPKQEMIISSETTSVPG